MRCHRLESFFVMPTSERDGQTVPSWDRLYCPGPCNSDSASISPARRSARIFISAQWFWISSESGKERDKGG